jgi:predicted ATPase
VVVTSPIRGRQAEVEHLQDAIRATAAGGGGVILLEGPAGIGKTALLGIACELAAGSGFVVCAADCDELDQMTRLAPRTPQGRGASQ